MVVRSWSAFFALALSGVLAACGSSDGGSMFPSVVKNDDGGMSQQENQDSTVADFGDGSAPPPGADAARPFCDGGCVEPDATLAYCGDGVVEAALGEQCDDGNSRPGDGCSGTCHVENGFTCTVAGKGCVLTVTQTCGNGKVDPGEACDDGTSVGGHGCSATCQVEPGWACVRPGRPCVAFDASQPAMCGDGMVEVGEQCDD